MALSQRDFFAQKNFARLTKNTFMVTRRYFFELRKRKRVKVF